LNSSPALVSDDVSIGALLMAKMVSCRQRYFFGLLKALFLQTFLLERHTVNAEYYQALLSDWLRPAIQSSWPGLLQKGVIL